MTEQASRFHLEEFLGRLFLKTASQLRITTTHFDRSENQTTFISKRKEKYFSFLSFAFWKQKESESATPSYDAFL
jgi:hypothetical protein